MTYLCGMKKSITLRVAFTLVILGSYSQSIDAQQFGGGFTPDFVPNFCDSVGARTLKFTTSFYWYSGSDTNQNFEFVGYQGITCSQSGACACYGYPAQVDIDVYVNLDSVPSCLYGPLGLCAYMGNECVALFSINGYTYNPQIIGEVSLQSDSLNFGNVPIGTDDSIYASIEIGTPGSVFRKLQPLNIKDPFSADSLIPLFGGCPAVPFRSPYIHFQPTQIGHYIDTTYIYDPIRKDSTMLILIGDGVAAGVTESTTAEPAMQVYPNPCDQLANIVLPSDGLVQVEIRNALGAIVQSYRNVNSDLTMDASTLPGGIYFIEARTGDAVVMKKLVVIH
jgi:hypothetical protein